jgi:bilirubin oxidase
VVSRTRDGNTVPAPFLAWKDTFNTVGGETVRFRVVQRFSGLRVFHCHIMEHESHGMMGLLQVV